MSHATIQESATCTLADCYTSLEDVIQSTIDFIVNHADEVDEAGLNLIPDPLLDSEDGATELEAYLAFDPVTKQLTITYDSDEANGDAEIHDWLLTHFAQLQVSPYLTNDWNSWDSRAGASGGTNYLGPDGGTIDVDLALRAYLRDRPQPREIE